jgi:hypothetical protein
MDDGSREETGDVLRSYAGAGYLETVPKGQARDATWRTSMARRAVADHGADWVISGDADEFWWPRGESLEDVLAVIPERYGIVQALVREFLPRPGDGATFAERMTIRPSLLVSREESREPLSWALRPVYRGHPHLTVEPGDGTANGRRVPLRAWYPIELFRFPCRSVEQAERRFGDEAGGPAEPRSRLESELLDAGRHGRVAERYAELVAGEERLSLGLDDGSLVEDTRLRDALRVLGAGSSATKRLALPAQDEPRLVLRPPDIVDDAAYAVECAAVGEVDLARLDEQIRELEERIGVLEARFWPRVARTLSRVVRR